MKIGRPASKFHGKLFLVIERSIELARLKKLLARNPVVGILGARQVGKTTLATTFAKAYRRPTTIFDLERSQDLARLEDPELTLEPLRGLIILDEIQRRPELFPTLRVLADRKPCQARFLVLGSASPSLLQQSSESLAGRIAYHQLSGFSLDEVDIGKLARLWLRGGFPRSFAAPSNDASHEWRVGFVQTFLERDMPQLGITIPARTLERFWAMLAHYHGNIWNASEFARSFGVSHHVMNRYLDALEGTFMVRVLRPYTANIRKRQVKSPKVYFRDSGLLHLFLDVHSMKDLERHPRLGASWEGFLIEAVIRRLQARDRDCYFWATHTGAELDLLVLHKGKRYGFEIKRTSAPKITPSMRSALESLDLHRLDVVHAGNETFPLSRKVRAVAAKNLLEDL